MTVTNLGSTSVYYHDAPKETSSLSSFLDWWFAILESASPNSLFIVALDGLAEDLAGAASEVVKACNHIVHKEEERAIAAQIAVNTIAFSETIFLDTETDIQLHRRYLQYYRRTLKSIQIQEKIPNGLHIHITHCSIDKEEVVVNLARTINQLNRSASTSFLILGLYRHPAAGYPPVKGNIDMRILPNKTQRALVSANFHRALRCINVSLIQKARCFLRLAIDDDDLWMPYALREFVNLATIIMQREGSSTRVLGIGNGFVYYPVEGGRIDLAPLSVALTGSKAYVSTSWSDIREKSPWTLAERYATNRMSVYEKQGIDVYFTRNARPVFIYVRYGSNLTSLDKTNLYISKKRTMRYVGGEDFAIEAGIELIKGSQHPGPPVFKLDPAILRLQGTVSLDRKFLKITSNIDEFLAERGLTATDVKILLRWRAVERRRAQWLNVSDEWMVPYADLVRAPSIEILDSTEQKLDKAWVMFEGNFPGQNEVSSDS